MARLTEITIREAAPSESAVILHHRRSMFRDMGEGTVEELDRIVEVASLWLARALADGSYRRWMARGTSVAAEACCCVLGRRILKIHAPSGR